MHRVNFEMLNLQRVFRKELSTELAAVLFFGEEQNECTGGNSRDPVRRLIDDRMEMKRRAMNEACMQSLLRPSFNSFDLPAWHSGLSRMPAVPLNVSKRMNECMRWRKDGVSMWMSLLWIFMSQEDTPTSQRGVPWGTIRMFESSKTFLSSTGG
mmetsp:Transcript_13809/g.27486  ORF Transcript_13809/g.27486 Transcript_13809/m.27486 type:complete len:154 (-) Transcript_13809:107-568(-)